MAIIRQKKKNLILSMILGMVISAVPLGIYGGNITYKKIQTEKKMEQVKKQISEEKSYQVYCLKEDKSKGELIEAEDLQEITVKTKHSFQALQVSDLEGKYLSVGVKSGVILTDSVIHEEEGLDDDVRTYLYDYIVLPEGITNEDLFDIRIRFPDGEDYVIAVGKKVESVVESGAFIHASEKENLLMSSAYVDTTVYEGAKIYASLYVADYQEASSPDYPLNLYATELASWNPNLLEELDTQTNRLNRQILEENLYDFMGVMMGGEKTQETYE